MLAKNSTYFCPDCKKEMEIGFFILRGQGANGFVDTIWKKELKAWEIEIVQQFGGPSFNEKLQAYRCKVCRIIQFKYANEGRYL